MDATGVATCVAPGAATITASAPANLGVLSKAGCW